MRRIAGRYTYRRVDADGIDAVGPLWKKLIKHHSRLLAHSDGKARNRKFATRKQELLAKADGGGLMIELVRHNVRGPYVAYCIASVSHGGAGEIDSLFVDEAHRGLGIGTRLMRRALAWLDRSGAQSKMISVVYANSEAIRFYSQFGFLPATVQLKQKTRARRQTSVR